MIEFNNTNLDSTPWMNNQNTTNVIENFCIHQDDISSDQYWAKKRFESQPGFILGKLLRECVVDTISALTNAGNFLISTTSNVVSAISSLPSNLNKIVKFIFWNEERAQFEMEFNQKIAEFHKALSAKIDAAKKEAQENNKPLLILVGENHNSESSAIIESLVLDIAAKKLSLKEVLTESFFSILKEKYRKYHIGPYSYLDEKIKAKGLQTINLDLAICQRNTGWIEEIPACKNNYPQLLHVENATSTEGIKIRNTVMADVAIHTELNDKIAVVGSAHLFGMIKETTLSEYYHILPINTWDCSLEQCFPEDENDPTFLYNCLSEEVLQTSIKERRRILFFSTAQLIEKAHHIHEEAATHLITKQSVGSTQMKAR